MNVFEKFYEIPSMIFEVIKETNTRTKHTDTRTVGQRENSIPSHKHSLRGYKDWLTWHGTKVVNFLFKRIYFISEQNRMGKENGLGGGVRGYYLPLYYFMITKLRLFLYLQEIYSGLLW